MNVKLLLGLFVTLLIVGCKKEKIRFINKDYSVSMTIPQNYQTTRVGESVPVSLSVLGLSKENTNEFQTIIKLGGNGGTILLGGKEIQAGEIINHDYRVSNMRMDFVYKPTTEGDKFIEAEVRSGGLTRKASINLQAISPKSALSFGEIPSSITPNTPIPIDLIVSADNENITLSAVFVKGSGKIETGGKLVTKDSATPITNGVNRLVFTFDKVGEQVIDLYVSGRYGVPQKVTLSLNVDLPDWSFEVTRQSQGETIDIGKNTSFIFNIRDKSIGNRFTCRYRFLEGNADLSFNGVSADVGRSFDVEAGSTIALISPKVPGKISIEFTITDRFGTEKKGVAIFYAKHPITNIKIKATPQTQNVLVGDEARVSVHLSEDNYNQTFRLKFERLQGEKYSLISEEEVSQGEHIFRYTPTSPGIYTFRTTVTDKHKQSSFEIFTLDARSQQIKVTAPKLEYRTPIHNKIPFEINVSEKGYNGKFYLYWDIDSDNQSTLYNISHNREQEITRKNYTEIINGKNVLSLIPRYVGTYPIRMTIKDERDQSISYSAIRITSTARVKVTATEGGRVEGDAIIDFNNKLHTVKAQPNYGYDFIHWYKSDDESKHPVSNASSYSFPVKDNVDLTALFKLKEYIIKVSHIGEGTVSIKGTSALFKSLEFGKPVTITATPKEGYTFSGWYLEGRKISDQPQYSFNVSGNATYEARFEVRKLKLNISSTAGGQVRYGTLTNGSHDATINYGSTVNLTAIPREKYRFLGWFQAGKVISSSLSYSFIMKENTSLEAKFELMIYKVSVSTNIPEAASSIGYTPQKTQFEYGDQVTVHCIPNSKHRQGYTFIGWYQGQNLLGSQLDYSFNAKQNMSLEARFKRTQYNLSIQKPDELIVSSFGNQTDVKVLYGETIQFLLQNKGNSTLNIDIYDGNDYTHISLNPKQVVNKNIICRGDMRLFTL